MRGEAAQRVRVPDAWQPGGLRGGLERLPTLSVGIGIGHVMESMGDLLDLGRRAEKVAKGGHLKHEGKDRNALAIILDKRSGGTRTWRAQWSEMPPPVQRLDADRKAARRGRGKRLSSARSTRSPTSSAACTAPRTKPDAEAGPEAAAGDELADFRPVLLAEVKRALERIDGGGGALTLEDVDSMIEIRAATRPCIAPSSTGSIAC